MIRLDYYTDALCSWCFVAEPTLRRLREMYGGRLEVRYRMFPLFEEVSEVMFHPLGLWNIADRWRLVSKRTGIAIDPRLWDEDPPRSAWPPCLAVKAAERQNLRLADRFLGLLRVAALTHRRNISRPEVLLEYAEKAGLDRDRFLRDCDSPDRRREVEEDVAEAQRNGVDSRPWFILTNPPGDRVVITGLRSYELFRQAVEALEAE